MLRDVFYYGIKPNTHPREKFATDLADARNQCTTEHFWIINELCDYTNFDWEWDFEFLPDEDVWAQDHNNVWPSVHQKDSGTWLCPQQLSEIIIYRVDVNPIKRKIETDPNWKIIHELVKGMFDFSWHPDPTDYPYIYVWGNKWNPIVLQSSIEYHVPSATEKKYMGTVEVLPELDKWKETHSIDKLTFDMSWRPDPREPAYIYVWGNKYDPAEVKATLEYHVPGATEKKYMGIVDLEPQWERWKEVQSVDKSTFDFRWRPDPNLHEPPYIYVWGNKHIPAELKATLEYHTPGATGKKYMNELVDVLPELDRWKEIQQIDKSLFDLSWRPDPREPPYIYVWGNKYDPAEVKATLEYHVPGATEKKYMGIVDLEPQWERWNEYILVDREIFDFRWRPDPNLHEPPYIYVWGNKFHTAEEKPTIEYIVPGATEKKYMGIVELAPEWDRWKEVIPVDKNTFDFRWRPDPNLHEPPLIYVFGSIWNDSKTEPAIEYHVPGGTDRKYMDYPVAVPKADMTPWTVNNKDDLETFDFSWRPNPHSQPQIYQWADNGPRYTIPDATEVVYMERNIDTIKTIVNRYKIKTTLADLVMEHPEEVFWAINPDLSYTKFDFSWRPSPQNFRHINTFGNEYSKDTQTYYINGPMYMLGYREYNYIAEQTVEIDSNLSMFFIDKNNSESTHRYSELKARYPQLQKTRYLNSWVDTINRCITKSTTELCWILNSELDYAAFEFDFYPSPWQMKMVHVFGTQWSHWGTTFMVNKDTFPDDTKYVKIVEHLSNLNFVKSKRAVASNCLYDIILIDHGNKENNDSPAIKIMFDTSYIETFKTMLTLLPSQKEHYIWICSSICDYGDFDFSYICDPFAKDQLHVFPSDKQKFGDTFLVDVNKLRSLIDDMTTLEDYKKINFNQHQRVNRLPAPVIIVEEDTHVEMNKYNFNFPYADFITSDNKFMSTKVDIPMSIWAPNHRNIIIKSTGGTTITAPKDVKKYINKELYDYPYIASADKLIKSNPLDIVFLSNGETDADKNYEHLLNVTKNLPNRVVRVDGINGRVAAYHAAVTASNTPWAFTVFAKLKVNEKFDFSWQPDRLQIPKHYIFYASNPVNGLVYGHQGLICYNKKLTLNNLGYGLDFTLDDEHDVIELNSGVAYYNTDVFITWRTSFREAIKLRLENSAISKYRLNIWSTVGEGAFAQYSIDGARHAVEYYNSVDGDIAKLRLSYDWPWLQEYFNTKYKL